MNPSAHPISNRETTDFILDEITLVFYIALSALILFFLSDVATKFLFYSDFSFYRVSLIVRIVYEVIFFAIIFIFLNRSRSQFLILFSIAVVVFMVGQLLFSLKVGYKYDYLENLSNFNKYFFSIIIYFSIYKLRYNQLLLERILKVFEWLVLINALAAIFGFIFSINWLRTYPQLYRNGYSGFFFAQNEATLFYFLAVSYFYYKHFIQKAKSSSFYLIIISSLLLGTKSIYLFLALLLFFHFLSNSKLTSKVLVALFGIAIYHIGGWFFGTESGQHLLAYFTSKAADVGWLSMLLSSRNETVITKGSELLSNWSFLNYIVGGQDQNQYLIEMDLIDLFFFFGLGGASIIIILYRATLFRFRLSNYFNLFFVSNFLLIAFFAGHLLSSAVCGLYLCLVCMFFYSDQVSLKETA